MTKAKEMLLLSRWYSNLIKNGNFNNGTTGYYIMGNPVLTVLNNNLNIVSDGVLRTVVNQKILNDVGDKLYTTFLYKTTGVNNFYFNANVGSGQGASGMPFYNLKNSVLTRFSAVDASFWANMYIGFIGAQGYAINVDIQYYFVINLTKMFGAQLEPTKEWCDINIIPLITW